MQNKTPSTAADDRRERADAHFKAREILKADAAQAMDDYRAAHDSVVARTRRLRAERLAREARPPVKAADAGRPSARRSSR